MVYKWVPGAHFKAPAQEVGEHLEKLRGEHGGLTAGLVVEDAKDPAHPTHAAFEWDDVKAANEQRLHTARVLMASVAVVLVDDEGVKSRETRAFVVVTDDGERAYTSVQVALADPTMRHQILARALRELAAWQRRYHDLQELAGIFAVAAEVADEVQAP